MFVFFLNIFSGCLDIEDQTNVKCFNILCDFLICCMIFYCYGIPFDCIFRGGMIFETSLNFEGPNKFDVAYLCFVFRLELADLFVCLWKGWDSLTPLRKMTHRKKVDV